MIRRIHIWRYKSLYDIELSLERLNLILGPNAAGKSNLFDALRLLSQIVTAEDLTKAFANHRGDPIEAFTFGEKGIEGLLEEERLWLRMEVDVELEPEIIRSVEEQIRALRSGLSENKKNPSSSKRVTERYLRYHCEIEMIPQTGVLRVTNEGLLALKEDKQGNLRPDKRRKPFLERVGNRLRLRMEGQARPIEYEVGLTHTLASRPFYPPHYPHLTAFREEVSRWRFYYFEPRLMREECALKEVEDLPSTGADLAAVYYTLLHKNPKQFENLIKSLSSIIPTIENVDIKKTREGKLQLKIIERNIAYSAKVISEGTLRVLALSAILYISPATLVGIEEPENGVHPRRLQLIANLIQNATDWRQIILNSHSPLLADYLSASDSTQRMNLIHCLKQDGYTIFKTFQASTKEPLLQRMEARDSVEEENYEWPSLTQRILQGEFDD